MTHCEQFVGSVARGELDRHIRVPNLNGQVVANTVPDWWVPAPWVDQGACGLHSVQIFVALR